MDSKISYKVNSKENIYFYLRLVASIALYFLIVDLFLESLDSESPLMKTVFVLYVYMVLILVFVFFRFGMLIGYLKGNAVKLSKSQFPEIWQVVVQQSELLGLKTTPSVFILQSGGLLNAFAARFVGRNYIVLFSEVVESALEQDKKILEFIIGHELGHIKRNHMIKKMILMPSYLIPFLGSAYSRACEYTCDNIGHAMSSAGVKSGLLLLASGRSIYKNVNIKEFLNQDSSEAGFWKWFSEKVSSHPNLNKRLACFVDANTPAFIDFKPVKERKEEDLSRFMPR